MAAVGNAQRFAGNMDEEGQLTAGEKMGGPGGERILNISFMSLSGIQDFAARMG